MKAIFVILLLGLSFLQLSGQTITNVVAVQEGDNAVITYNLDCDGSADIALYYSEDNGTTYQGPIKNASGDVGNQIVCGTNKRIIWNVLQEQDLLIGDKIVFQLKGYSKFGRFTDIRDGRTYKTVKIGNQVWMAENLNFKTSTGSWCYDDITSNCDIYGRLYDWETAMNSCPTGWHLPSENEWEELLTALGGHSLAGGKMKEAGTTHWKTPNKGASNSSGFSALPGGHWNVNQLNHKGNYEGINEQGWFLSRTSTENAWYDFSHGQYLRFNSESGQVGSGFYKKSGESVRCIQD